MNPLDDTALLLGLSNTVGKLQKQLGGALAAHGISFTDYLVLKHLHQAPERRLRRIDLAESVGLSASGVTRLLNPMQKIGLVGKEENPRDARVSLVTLTDAGARIYEESELSVASAASRALSRLGDGERAALHGIIEALR